MFRQKVNFSCLMCQAHEHTHETYFPTFHRITSKGKNLENRFVNLETRKLFELVQQIFFTIPQTTLGAFRST